MSLFSVKNIRLAGVAASVPRKSVSNYDLELLSPKERELLVRSVGIEKRRIADPGTCTSDLCFSSAQALLRELSWDPATVDVLVFITQTPDYITPSTSNILQHKLALGRGCIALDINLGCSGYVYGLAVASSLLSAMGRGRALVLAGDISTATISFEDKSTVPIFSDAGSATALHYDADAAVTSYHLQGDGKGFNAIIIPHGGYRNPVSLESLQTEQAGEGILRNKTHLILNGIDVFNFSVNEVPGNVEELLRFSGQERTAIDYFVFHQANLLINESIRKKLKLTPQQVPYSLRDFGNTSSATIPVTMVTQLAEALRTRPLKMVFSGFGVGLSWSSMFTETTPIACPSLIEV